MKTPAMNKSLCLGVTGGIGSGKSYVCRMLEQRGVPVFYTDDEAKLEMRSNTAIHQELCAIIGPEVLDACGRPVKDVLSQYIRQSAAHAQRVNDIVHPRVRERAMRWLNSMHHSSITAIECALLFESGFNSLCQKTLTVSAPLQVRINRICHRDNITPAKAREWIDLQMPQEEKIRLSDYVICNDGTQNIDRQVDHIVKILLHDSQNC